MQWTTASACLAILALCVSGSVSSAAECPQSCLSISWHNGFCVSSAQLDTTSSGGSCGNEVGFDIPGGTLFCTTVGGYGNCWGGTDVADDFVIAGAPIGKPVNLSVELAINTSSFGGASATGTIKRDDAAIAAWTHEFPDVDPMTEVDTTLRATIPVTVGVPFRLHFTLDASAGGDAIRVVSLASFSFDGLGPGERIESCKGFVQAPTAVLPTTWGRLKSLYR